MRDRPGLVAAKSTMAWLRSVATISTSAGSRFASASVTIPVPALVLRGEESPILDRDVAVYGAQFTGALQGYRVRRGSDPRSIAEMQTFSGRTIDVPSEYIAGKSDWGTYQTAGAVDKMRNSACTHMVGFHLLDGAGHWVQQEQPELVSALLVQFLRDYAKP